MILRIEPAVDLAGGYVLRNARLQFDMRSPQTSKTSFTATLKPSMEDFLEKWHANRDGTATEQHAGSCLPSLSRSYLLCMFSYG